MHPACGVVPTSIITAWLLPPARSWWPIPTRSGGAGGVIAVDPGNGRQTVLSRGDLFVDPSNVAFLADGRLVISDTGAFGGSGGLIAVDPTNGRQTKIAASTVFKFPSGMAIDGRGQILVAYPERVQVRAACCESTRRTATTRLSRQMYASFRRSESRAT